MTNARHDSFPAPTLSRTLSRTKKLVFVSLIALICFVLVETALNGLTLIGILPVNDILSPWFYKPIVQRASSQFDTYGSPISVSGYKIKFTDRGLVGPPVYYDERGYRSADSSRFMSMNYKVGVFGDSYTEGLLVDDAETYPRVLDQLLESNGREDIDIYNFGVGGTGTYHQFLRYLTVSEDVDLNLVILGFLPGNDVLNNYRPLGQVTELPGSPYYDPARGSVSRPRPSDPNGKIKAGALTKRIFEYTVGSSFVGRAVYFGPMLVRTRVFGVWLPTGESSQFGVYKTPSIEWEKAWKITEEIILKFAAVAHDKDDDFVVLIVADWLQIANGLGSNIAPGGYSYSYPNQRIIAFCESHTLRCYDSLPFFIERGRALNLAFPFYSWIYDGHYARIGHKTMAEYLYSVLQVRVTGKPSNDPRIGVRE